MNEQNLIPFKEGQSGNPKGKPKGTIHLTTLLKKMMVKKFSLPELTGHNRKLTTAELIVLRLAKDAIRGNAHAQDTIIERLEGKVTQHGEQNVNVVTMPQITVDGKPLEYDIGSKGGKV
jgi:hypothetical protein